MHFSLSFRQIYRGQAEYEFSQADFLFRICITWGGWRTLLAAKWACNTVRRNAYQSVVLSAKITNTPNWSCPAKKIAVRHFLCRAQSALCLQIVRYLGRATAPARKWICTCFYAECTSDDLPKGPIVFKMNLSLCLCQYQVNNMCLSLTHCHAFMRTKY